MKLRARAYIWGFVTVFSCVAFWWFLSSSSLSSKFADTVIESGLSWTHEKDVNVPAIEIDQKAVDNCKQALLAKHLAFFRSSIRFVSARKSPDGISNLYFFSITSVTERPMFVAVEALLEGKQVTKIHIIPDA
jgi:hypothetical protein